MIRFILAPALIAFAFVADAKTLRVGGTQTPSTLGNPYSSVGPPGSTTWSAIFDGLTGLDVGNNLVPALALSWKSTGDRTWEFKLRPGVTFHDGSTFDADDVVEVINALKTPEGQRFIAATELRIVDSVRAVDPMTVEFTTVERDAILPKRLNIIMIVEPNAWKRLGPEGFGLTPIGTGPFILKDWGRSSGRIVLEAFKNSWRAPAEVTRLEIAMIGDTAARTQAMLAGQIDIAVALNPEDAKMIEGRGASVQWTPSSVVMSLAFRTERPEDAPLKDKRVRLALNMAVDRQGMVDGILGGTTRVSSQGATAETAGYNAALAPFPYDPAWAKALLAEAGYPNGLKLTSLVMTNLGMSDSAIYQKMADDLAKVGVDLELRSSTFANWLRFYSTGEWGDIDAFSLTWNSAPFGDVIRPVEYFSCLKAAPFFCDPSVVPLIKASNQEMDPAKREEMLRQIMTAYHDIVPALWLVDFTNPLVISDRIENVINRPIGIEFENVRFRK
jgi:peptide/nickel transport system substrate-binding protein